MVDIFLLPFFSLLLAWNAPAPNTFTDPRDGEIYHTIEIDNLKWFGENLRYRSALGHDTLVEIENCGVFYLQADAEKACPDGWRLPTGKEIKALIKADKKGKIDLSDTLNIVLCGRIDYEKHAKAGTQNTFWLQAELKNGHIAHWHTFGQEHTTHTHDVIQARRKFPVRCVCEVELE